VVGPFIHLVRRRVTKISGKIPDVIRASATDNRNIKKLYRPHNGTTADTLYSGNPAKFKIRDIMLLGCRRLQHKYRK